MKPFPFILPFHMIEDTQAGAEHPRSRAALVCSCHYAMNAINWSVNSAIRGGMPEACTSWEVRL
jgi:hypothetical protein